MLNTLFKLRSVWHIVPASWPPLSYMYVYIYVWGLGRGEKRGGDGMETEEGRRRRKVEEGRKGRGGGGLIEWEKCTVDETQFGIASLKDIGSLYAPLYIATVQRVPQ